MENKIYFATAYDAKNKRFNPIFIDTDKSEIISKIEDNDGDWCETIYSHAILYSIRIGSLDGAYADFIGVYSRDVASWIKFNILSEVETNLFPKYYLTFQNQRLACRKICNHLACHFISSVQINTENIS